MNLLRVRRLFAGEQVARFGTTGPGGHPHMMPVPFAVIDDGDDGVIVCTIDHEPRSLSGFARLHDIAASPRVSFLADQSLGGARGQSRDGSRDEVGRGAAQWWVQAEAVAEVLRRGNGDPRLAMARTALADRYPQYRVHPPAGPLVWGTVTGWTGWTAALEAAA